MNIDFPILKKDYECAVCGKCILACKHDCISFELGKINYQPFIDFQKCILCKECEKACNDDLFVSSRDDVFESYLCESMDDNLIKNSSSGGLFSELAYYVLNQDGIVVGVTYDEITKKIKHTIVTNKSEIGRCRKSKYVQSDPMEIYSAVRQAIESKKLLLLTGTPCQIAPVREKYKSHTNIICVDLYCHGVINAGVFNDYISEPEDDLIDIDFRSEGKLGNFNIKYSYKSKDYKTEWCEDDLLYRSYINGISIKKECITCKYSNSRHISDITIGDYNQTIANSGFSNTPSIMTINTSLGKKVKKEIEKNLKIKALDNGEVLSKYYIKHEARMNTEWGYNQKGTEEFLELFEQEGVNKAIHETLDDEIIRDLRQVLKDDCSSIWIYGAGKLGKRVFKVINDLFNNVKIKGFIVSEKCEEKKIYGKDILAFDDYKNNNNSEKIIVAVYEKKDQVVIEQKLCSINADYFIVCK